MVILITKNPYLRKIFFFSLVGSGRGRCEGWGGGGGGGGGE